jgi:hypothetical protein
LALRAMSLTLFLQTETRPKVKQTGQRLAYSLP